MKPVLVLRQVPHEGLGLLAEVLREHHVAYSYLDLFDDPPHHVDVSRLSGLVILGGPMNADQTDEHPFLAHEVQWIGEAVGRGLPVLGICLGSQLLAKALGASVYAAERKEIGWCTVEMTEAAGDDPLLATCGPRETVFQWHGDTFDLPPGATWLARSDVAPNQAFRFGRSVWGLQFHIELTPVEFDMWLREPGMCGEIAHLDYVDGDEIERRAVDEFPRLQQLGRRILSPFAALCRNGNAS
ncbi:MAG: type 1 glutamine amidotransferase [Pirellulaceae bacterium]